MDRQKPSTIPIRMKMGIYAMTVVLLLIGGIIGIQSILSSNIATVGNSPSSSSVATSQVKIRSKSVTSYSEPPVLTTVITTLPHPCCQSTITASLPTPTKQIIATQIPIPTTSKAIATPLTNLTTPITMATRVNPICISSHINGLSNTQLNSQLNLMKQAGVRWTRFDFTMAAIEPTQGNFSWTMYDTIVKTANTYGIQIIALIDQYDTPGWANGNHRSMYAPSPTLYQNFSQAVAAHYNGQISLFEMGNEPNISGFWPPTPDPVSYTALLKAGYTGIKAANPSAKVISAGLAQAQSPNDPISFLTAMYNNGAKGYFDYAGMHPYSQPNGPDFVSSNPSAASFSILQKIRNLLVSEGDGNKQIMVTEIGWPTTSDFSGGGVTQANQAAYISRVYKKIMHEDYQYVPIACTYDFVNDGTVTTYNEDNFGLLNSDYSTKASYTSLQNASVDFATNFIEIAP